VTTNGTGVVAERTVDGVSPAATTGLADVGGSRLERPRWLLAAGSPGPSLAESLAVYNPGTTAVDVSVAQLDGEVTDISGLAGATLPPGRRLVVPIDDRSRAFNRALVIDATGNVIVERDLTRVNGVGIDATLGIPLDRS
jgi:hypothetical protein